MSKYKTEELKRNALTVTVEEAAKLLGISKFLAWRLVNEGSLPTIRLGKLYRVPRIRLMRILEGDDNKPEETPQG